MKLLLFSLCSIRINGVVILTRSYTCSEGFFKCYALYSILPASLHTACNDVIGTLATEVLDIGTHPTAFTTLKKYIEYKLQG